MITSNINHIVVFGITSILGISWRGFCWTYYSILSIKSEQRLRPGLRLRVHSYGKVWCQILLRRKSGATFRAFSLSVPWLRSALKWHIGNNWLEASRNKLRELLSTPIPFTAFLEEDNYRLVIQRKMQKADEADLFDGKFVYRWIVPNDWGSTKEEIITFYNVQGTSAKKFNVINKDFLSFSFMNESTTFLLMTAMAANFYQHLISKIMKIRFNVCLQCQFQIGCRLDEPVHILKQLLRCDARIQIFIVLTLLCISILLIISIDASSSSVTSEVNEYLPMWYQRSVSSPAMTRKIFMFIRSVW